jgi:hypothetical protein
MPTANAAAMLSQDRRELTMAAIDVSRRYELERLVGELRLAARTIRSSTVAERRASCESLAQTLRRRLEPHAALDAEGLEALDVWTNALERADALDVDLLQELLYGIDALVRVHLWRETGFPLQPPEPRGRAEV